MESSLTWLHNKLLSSWYRWEIMLLVNFAVQSNREESVGGIANKWKPHMISHNQVRSSTASEEKKKKSHSVMRLRRQRAETPELFCRSRIVPGSGLLKPALTLLILLALGSVAQAVVCMKRGLMPSSPGSRVVLVHSCLWANKNLESAWLCWELALPGLNC